MPECRTRSKAPPPREWLRDSMPAKNQARQNFPPRIVSPHESPERAGLTTFESYNQHPHIVSATRAWCPTVILLALWFTPGASIAAERRAWATFTNCQYVVTKDSDGDSFRIRSGTNEFTVRLYFVDAPETNLRYAERNRDQAEHFGITLDETVRAGVKATEVTRALLREPFTVRTRWASAAGGGREPRYYSFVDVGTNSLATLLVAQGWARTKGVTATLPGQNSKDFAARLRGLEAEARTKRLGIWKRSTDKKPEPE